MLLGQTIFSSNMLLWMNIFIDHNLMWDIHKYACNIYALCVSVSLKVECTARVTRGLSTLNWIRSPHMWRMLIWISAIVCIYMLWPGHHGKLCAIETNSKLVKQLSFLSPFDSYCFQWVAISLQHTQTKTFHIEMEKYSLWIRRLLFTI